MNAATLRELFESLPEIQALMQCARRLGVAIGLRGGVVRNMLLTEGADSGRFDSLYDFVDPFGDIDLVVTDDAKESVLARALFAEVPFADCHFWDLQTVESGVAAAKREGSVAADALTVWFDGQDDHRAETRLDATESDVKRILDAPMRPLRPLTVAAAVSPAAIARFVKFARIQIQMESSERVLVEPLARFADRFRRLVHDRQRPLSRRTTLDIEIELAQMLMTAPDWRGATALQGQLREVLTDDWLREGSALRQMLTVRPGRDTRIGAALYKPSMQAPPKLEFMSAEAEDARTGDANRSRIPWTHLRLKNQKDGTCCPYSDFEEGIAVVAWRNTGGEATRLDQQLSEEEYGLVAYPIAPTQSLQEVLGRNRRIPMLGYVRKGRSIVTRVDPAYLKMITGGRFSTFMVGLVSVLTSGEIETPQTNPPITLAPEGEKTVEDETGKQKKPGSKEEEWKKRRKILVGEPVLT